MVDVLEFERIKKEISSLSDRKIRAEERFKSQKDRLEKVMKEIISAGYDPKKITEIRKESETALAKHLQELKIKIDETNEKLKTIESN